jgi:Flp pilus assembly protein TadG
MAAVLIIFAGLAIDSGNAFVTKAALAKAVDAASLGAVRNLQQGDTQAERVARAVFAANYHGGGVETQPTTVNFAIRTDAANNKSVVVSANSTVKTYLIGLVPRFRTISVNAAAEATRSKLIMAMVLDRSGSMTRNGGSTALPPAVRNFVSFFDDSCDDVAMCSYATLASTDVALHHPFKGDINSALNRMVFYGATWADGGLQLGRAQVDSAVILPFENVVKVMVFFTDGLANTFRYTWAPNYTYHVGGTDPPQTDYAVMNATTGSESWGPPWPSSLPPRPTTFVSITGSTLPITTLNLRDEGRLRAENTAMLARRAGITIFCIGLGSNLDAAFLKRVANDPTSPTYDASQPSGQVLIAPTSADLRRVFEAIAANILLRLTM